MSLLVRMALKALAFIYLLPMIPGIRFHGGFLAALAVAVFFSVMLWVIEKVAGLLAAFWAIATLGVALLVLIPLWIFGFWIIPAIALRVIADIFPQYLTVHGLVPAALGGLVLLVVGMLTGGLTSCKESLRRRN